MKLNDRIAFITGAARGIGKAIAEHYAKEGAKVVIADLNVAMFAKYENLQPGEKKGWSERRSPTGAWRVPTRLPDLRLFSPATTPTALLRRPATSMAATG